MSIFFHKIVINIFLPSIQEKKQKLSNLFFCCFCCSFSFLSLFLGSSKEYAFAPDTMMFHKHSCFSPRLTYNFFVPVTKKCRLLTITTIKHSCSEFLKSLETKTSFVLLLSTNEPPSVKSNWICFFFYKTDL